MRIYIGTYSGNIWQVELSPSGTALIPKSVAALEAPAFLTLHPHLPVLYALSETDPGRVTAYAIHLENGHLQLKNQQHLSGSYTCHISVDPQGQTLFAASYGSGHVHALPLTVDGALGPETTCIHHEGHGPNPQRQEGPHVHCTVPHPFAPYLFVADLGVDRVFVYRVLPHAYLELVETAALPPGAGPRHISVHPNGRFVYVINELNSTVSLLTFDPSSGSGKVVRSYSTLLTSHQGENYPSEVALSPDAFFLYGANRGHNSLALFRVEQNSGELQPIESVATEGHWPRHFAISPDGRLLAVANQNSDTVVLFSRDLHNGKLHPTGQKLAIAAPSCILWVR